MKRARVVTLNAALGPLDYRVPEDMAVEPGSIVVAPSGPRQLLGVAWDPERLRTNEVPDARLRPLAGVLDVAPIAEPLRRFCEWTADYYLSPLASVLRMVLPSSAALDGPRQLTEYRPTGVVPIASLRSGTRRLLHCKAGKARSGNWPIMLRSATRSCAVSSMPALWKRSPSTRTAPSPAPILISRRQTSMTINAVPPRAWRAQLRRVSTRSYSTVLQDRARRKSISKQLPNACARESRRSSSFRRSHSPSLS